MNLLQPACSTTFTALGDWHRVGITQYHLKNFEAAATAYQNLVARDPKYADAWLNLGRMLYEQNKLDDALEAYHKARALRPNDRKTLYMIGRILVAKNQWDRAIEILDTQVKRDTLATESWLLLAQAHRHKGDTKNAQEALATYIGAQGDRPEGWAEYFELGKLYQGHIDAAQTIYRSVLKMLPSNKEVQDSLHTVSN